jgi:hypothetical protein
LARLDQQFVRNKIARNANTANPTIYPTIRRTVTSRNRVKPNVSPKLVVARKVKVVKRDPAIAAKIRRRNSSCFLNMLSVTKSPFALYAPNSILKNLRS